VDACAAERRGRPTADAEGTAKGRRRRTEQRRTSELARAAAARSVRVRDRGAALNRYDRQDPRFRVASDEPTAGKRECRSNRRNSYAPR
jgi:hypothetical protein